MTNNEYLKWMYNSHNEYNCSECPENKGYNDHEGKLPCSQQNCWVTCHCRSREEAENRW